MREAMLYERLDDKRVRCVLCAHRCLIKPGRRGICGVRENRDGTLYSLVDGRIIAENLDPIEKKPLFHVCPGSLSFSVASVGCNFHCVFCQNYEISQVPQDQAVIPGRVRTPEQIVDYAARSGALSIAYTYTEPTVFFEFVYETARLAHEKNILNLFITNGFLTPEALDLAAPVLDAANVDLKSFSDSFYRKYCGGRLQPVLDTLRGMHERGIWIEVTTLIIPGLNDSPEELRDIARFIRSLGPEVPWHISRFHPHYKLHTTGATPPETIQKACRIGAEEGLKYVYSGNLPGDEGEKTRCSSCGELLIDRYGFRILGINLSGTACPRCGTQLDGILQCGGTAVS